jgi:hypothetical protein
MNYNCKILSSHGDIKSSYYLFGSYICVGRQKVTDITDKHTVSIFNLEAGCVNFAGIIVIIHQAARLYTPEDGSFNANRNENLKFHILFVTQL